VTSGPRLSLLAVNPTGLVGGAEIVLLRLLTAATADGMDVTCLSPTGPLERRLADAGIRHQLLPDLKLGTGPRAVAAGRLATRTAQAAVLIRQAASRADVVLVNGFFALPALRLARTPTPTVWLVHDVVHPRSWARILDVVKGTVGMAVAVSDAAAAPIRAAGIPVVVIRNGTPWPVAPRTPIPPTSRRPSPPVIGCAGLLTPWKGQDVLLEAVARLPDRSVRVELAGGQFPKDGPYVAQLHRRAERADLAGRVEFLGSLADPLDRLRAWDVLVSPSVDPEAASLLLIEAMSVGLPVVATDHGGTPEVLGGAGLLVPPGDPDALAGAIAALLDDPTRWEACHHAGPALVEGSLQLSDQHRAMLDVVCRQLAGSAP
jgi:glycosyltransferase involved in cell wall biosynthesis